MDTGRLEGLKREMNEIKQSIDLLGDGGVCPVCAQSLSETDRTNLLDRRNTLGKSRANEYRALIGAMKSEFASAVFGLEKDASFDTSVSQIYQTFDGSELYPSLDEKAATLLYLVVKNHSFADGNKRIAAACFLYFLDRNHLLTTLKGETLLSDDALAAVPAPLHHRLSHGHLHFELLVTAA